MLIPGKDNRLILGMDAFINILPTDRQTIHYQHSLLSSGARETVKHKTFSTGHLRLFSSTLSLSISYFTNIISY